MLKPSYFVMAGFLTLDVQIISQSNKNNWNLLAESCLAYIITKYLLVRPILEKTLDFNLYNSVRYTV